MQIYVHPKAARSEVLGLRDGILHVKIAAPPVEGRANMELVGLLSRLLGIAKSRITVEKGKTGRWKAVAVSGMERDRVLSLLTRSKGSRD